MFLLPTGPPYVKKVFNFPKIEPSSQNMSLMVSSSEASPTFGHANANLNDYHYSFLRNWFLVRSINTEKFAFA